MPVIEVPERPYSQLALAADALALAAGRQVVLVDRGTGAERATVELPWVPAALALSPSGERLAAAPPAPRTALLVHGRANATLPKLPGGWLGGFAFVTHRQRELLLVARDQTSVSIHDPDTLEELDRIAGSGFEFDSFHPLGSGLVASVGHGTGETRDSLVVLDLDALVLPADELEWAYRVAAGPAPGGRIVVFRDPEDGEDPDPDDDDEGEERPLHGFRGLYVRDLASGAIVEAVDWDGPLASGDPCFASTDTIVIAMREALALVPRTGASATLLPAAATALDAPNRRAARITAPGTVEIIDV